MKVHVLSDLHLESAPFEFEPTDADLCILAGDISSEREDVVALIKEIEKHYPVVFTPGNHEYYPQVHEDFGESIIEVDEQMRTWPNVLPDGRTHNLRIASGWLHPLDRLL